MLIKNVYGVFKYAPKAAQNSPMTITTANGDRFILETSDFTKDGRIRIAVVKKLKALGINW